VRLTPEQRTALQTIGNAAIGVGLGMGVLGIALAASQFAAGQGSLALPTRTQAPAPRETASSPVAVAATASPSPSPTPPPSTATSPPTSPSPPASATDPPAAPTPTPSPTSRPDEMSATPYSSGGRRYAALHAPVGYVYRATMAGTVQVRQYQLIDGEVRVGSFVPTLPFFPYVTLESSDRRVIYRPGALNADTELLVKDGERADLGTPLFKTIGDGASSWRAFYDRGTTANVIVSVAALPSGAEVDPVAFFAAR
jgi:hypothetical protein